MRRRDKTYIGNSLENRAAGKERNTKKKNRDRIKEFNAVIAVNGFTRGIVVPDVLW